MTTPTKRAQSNLLLLSLIGVWLAGILAAGALGGVTNLVNSQISALYFRETMRWQEIAGITRAIVAQGVFEGLIFGLILSTVFIVVVGFVSRAACPFAFGARHVGLLMLLALGCWAVGGLLAMSLAALSPEFYSQTFKGVPEGFGPMLRYAWVGGSIWGVEFGGAAATLVVAVIFRAAWKRREANQVDR